MIYSITIPLIGYLFLFSWHITPPRYQSIDTCLGYTVNNTHKPGPRIKIPWPFCISIDVFTSPQTDYITNVPCTSRDNVIMPIPKIAVGNTLTNNDNGIFRTINTHGYNYDQYLVKDKISAQINIICSEYSHDDLYIHKYPELDDMLKNFLQDFNDQDNTSSVHIDFVRVDKPKLPKPLQEKYEQLAIEKTAQKVAKEARKRQEAEDTNKLAIAQRQAERDLVIAAGKNTIKLENKETDEKENIISNRMFLHNEITKANATFAKMEAEANGNAKLLTKEKLRELEIKAMHNNAKYYFDKTPNTFFMKEDNREYSNEEMYSSKYDKLSN